MCARAAWAPSPIGEGTCRCEFIRTWLVLRAGARRKPPGVVGQLPALAPSPTGGGLGRGNALWLEIRSEGCLPISAGGGTCRCEFIRTWLVRRACARRKPPGAARQLVTFLVLPRKVTQRRRPRFAAPAGFPRSAASKRGCATRPGGAHKPCPTAELEQCSPKPPLACG